MTIHVRFAPSPTGFLHIGGARTALFNYLYAKKQQGTFLLRIEDTDQARSTQAAIDAIYDGLTWLGLTTDTDTVMQSANLTRHKEVVQQLLDQDDAYYCYTTTEELAKQRAAAQAEGTVFKYDRRWRDVNANDAPQGISPSVRLKAPLHGSITIDDEVQGKVAVDCSELDDMVLMRADGTPTYLLAVVVDDHDMGITHIIRGDDHFTNTFRQALIYKALGWEIPVMAHVPLIHGADGAKLSKRHGALGVDAYRDMGYLPEAIRNYLLRLGWSHGDDEIISDEQAAAWFGLDGLGKSPARFDIEKLNHVNSHYIRQADATRLCSLVIPFIESHIEQPLSDSQRNMLSHAMPELQARATTLRDLAQNAAFFFRYPTDYTPKAQSLLEKNVELLKELTSVLSEIVEWTAEGIQSSCEAYGAAHDIKLGKIMNPLRAAITASHASPSMFHVMPLLGKDECLTRIDQATKRL